MPWNESSFAIKDDPTLKAEDIMLVKPAMLVVLGYFTSYAEQNKLPVVITNVVLSFPTSRSTTHPDGRAIDISARHWTPEHKQGVIKYMEDKVGYLGAYSFSDGKQRVIIYHDGGLGAHFHLQIHRGAKP